MDLQEVFNKIQEAKGEMRKIRKDYKDDLAQTENYADTVEKLTELREKKKQIETWVQGQMGRAWERYEELKNDVTANEQMLSDIAMTTLMDGKTVEVVDEFSNKYEPIYVVRLRKTNEIVKEEKRTVSVPDGAQV